MTNDDDKPLPGIDYQTTLAEVAAKGTPDYRPGREAAQVDALTSQKIAALDFSAAGVAAMLAQIERQLEREDHPGRRRSLKEAQAGLRGPFKDGKPTTELWAIWDVFGYWPAIAEVVAQRPPDPPQPGVRIGVQWFSPEEIERLRAAAARPGRRGKDSDKSH